MVFEVESFSESDFIMEQNCSSVWEEGTPRKETTEGWLEQPCFADKLLLTEEDNVPFQLSDGDLSMRTGARTEEYPEDGEHIREHEDSLNKYLENDSLVINMYETTCASQVATSSTSSPLGNSSLSLLGNTLPIPFNPDGHTIGVSPHSTSAWFSQNGFLDARCGTYPPTTGMMDNSSHYKTEESNRELFSNIEYSSSGNHACPFCFAATRYDKLSLQEKGNDSSFQYCDACIPESVKKCSDIPEELKQSCSRQVFHMCRKGPYLLSKREAESCNLHGMPSLENSSVSNDILSSLTDFDAWREEINGFLKQYGVSRREFAKAARIGKNTVGKYLSGQCKKLSKEIVWKILGTYHTLRLETPLIESEQSDALKVYKRRRTPTATILQESQRTVSYLDANSEAQRDPMNATCVENEDLEAEQADSSGNLPFGSLEEPHTAESSGTISIDDKEISKEATKNNCGLVGEVCGLHFVDSYFVGQPEIAESNVAQRAMEQMESGWSVQGGSVWVNSIDEELNRSFRQDGDVSLRGSNPYEEYLFRLVEMQPEETHLKEVESSVAQHRHSQNREPFATSPGPLIDEAPRGIEFCSPPYTNNTSYIPNFLFSNEQEEDSEIPDAYIARDCCDSPS